jgi:hypothetical protein
MTRKLQRRIFKFESEFFAALQANLPTVVEYNQTGLVYFLNQVEFRRSSQPAKMCDSWSMIPMALINIVSSCHFTED